MNKFKSEVTEKLTSTVVKSVKLKRTQWLTEKAQKAGLFMLKRKWNKEFYVAFILCLSLDSMAANGGSQGGSSSDTSTSNAGAIVNGSTRAQGFGGLFSGLFQPVGNVSGNARNYSTDRLNHQVNGDGTSQGTQSSTVVSGGTATGGGNGGDNSTDIHTESSYEEANGEQIVLKSASLKSNEQDRCFGIERDNLPEEFRKIVDSTCPNVLAKDYCGCLLSLVSNSSPLGEKIKTDYPKAKKNMMAVNYRSLLKRWSEAYIDSLGAMISNQSVKISNDNVCSPAKMLESVITRMKDRTQCKGDPEAFGIAAQNLINPDSKLDAKNVDFSKVPLQSFLTGMMNGSQSRNIILDSDGKVQSFNCLDPGQSAILSLLPRYFDKNKIDNPSKPSEDSRSALFGLQNSINITDTWIKRIDAETLQNSNGDFNAEATIKSNRGLAKVLKLFPGLDLLITTLSYAKPYETQADKEKRLKALKEALVKINTFSTELTDTKLNSPKISNKDLIEKINSYSAEVKSFVEKQSAAYVDDIKDVSEGKCVLLQHDLALIACADDTLLDDRAQVLSAFSDASRDRSLGGIENAQNCKSDKDIALQCMTYNYVTCRKQSEIELAPVVDLLGNFKVLSGRTRGSVVRRVADSYWRDRVEDAIIGDVCSNYTAFLKEKKCGASESAAQACLLNTAENGLTSPAYTAWLKQHDLDETDGAGVAGASSGNSKPNLQLDESGSLINPGDESHSRILAGIKSSINDANPVADTSFGSQFLKAATVGAAATTADNKMNNSTIPSYITPTQTIPQQLARKDEAIAAKESEISERVNDAKSIQDPVLKSAAEEELKALRAELASLKKEREALAAAQQETETQVAENAANNKNANQTNRSPASVSGSSTGSSFAVGAGGSSTTGASTGGGSTSGSTSGFGNTSSASGGSSSAPVTVQAALNSIGSGSSALLEANQLKLTVGGQEVVAQNVTTLQIPTGASRDVIQKVIQDNESKLKFVDGVALVELIGADKKPIYYQVKKQGEGFELIAVKEDIPAQVRKWSASYANFMKKIQTIRGPSGQSTEGRQ